MEPITRLHDNSCYFRTQDKYFPAASVWERVAFPLTNHVWVCGQENHVDSKCAESCFSVTQSKKKPNLF